MKSNLNFSITYLICYIISGCNYIVFSLVLKNQPILNIALYCGISSLVLYSPVYRFFESRIIKKAYSPYKITFKSIEEALTRQGRGILLSVVCSIGWQVITYTYLIFFDPVLALLVVTFSRLLTPFLSSYLFGDSIGDKVWYWCGLFVSLLGMFLYETGLKSGLTSGPVNWPLYIFLSVLNIFFLVCGSIIKRFITTDPRTDARPVRKYFLTIKTRDSYILPVAVRGCIVDFFTFVTLFLFGIAMLFYSKSSPDFNIGVVGGLLWIGVIGTIAFNLSLRLTNILSNVTTVVIDGIRPAATIFIFPLITFIINGAVYALPFSTPLIFGFHLYGANIIGIGLCCFGALISLKYGRPSGIKKGAKKIQAEPQAMLQPG